MAPGLRPNGPYGAQNLCDSSFQKINSTGANRTWGRRPGSWRDVRPGGPFEHPFGERADDDGGDDHADGSPEARDEVRLCMVGPEPDDQSEEQRQAGGQSGELVEHEGDRADGMRDQSHRQRDDDEQGDEAGDDDGDARYIASI